MLNITSAPSEVSDSAQLTPSHIVLVPHWVARALRRNKLNYIDLLNYATVARVLSVSDQTELLYCNTYMGSRFGCQQDDAGMYLLECWRTSPMLSQNPIAQTQLEHCATHALFTDTATIAHVDAALAPVLNPDTQDPTDADLPIYEITLGADRNLYVQLNRGFLRQTKPVSPHPFFVALLQTLYTVQSTHWVAKHTGVFLKYVTAL